MSYKNIFKVLSVVFAIFCGVLAYQLVKSDETNKAMLNVIESQKQEINDLNEIIKNINKELNNIKEEQIIKEEIKQAEAHLGDNEYVSNAYSGSTMFCRITHYSSEETGSNITASGNIAQLNHTIACNTLPLGTKVRINGIVYTVEDTGDMDGNGIDIYVSCSAEAFERGTYVTEVEVL